VLAAVASAEEAVEAVARRTPDIVLMDIHLKGRMDGIEAAGAIRQRYHVPVIYLTAHSDMATLARAKVTEPFGYLLKPFDERDLRVAIELALHKHEMERRLRESEERLHQAQMLEAIGRLAGGVAHDVNNMMTVVLGYAELLLQQVDKADPRREGLLEMRRAANRSADIARQLLAVGQRQVLQPVVVDLDRLVDDMRPTLMEVLGEGIELRCQLDTGAATVLIDPNQFERVMINLCLNAREAMPVGGVVTIASHQAMLGKDDTLDAPEIAPGHYVLLSVSDTGPEHQPANRSPADGFGHAWDEWSGTRGAVVGGSPDTGRVGHVGLQRRPCPGAGLAIKRCLHPETVCGIRISQSGAIGAGLPAATRRLKAIRNPTKLACPARASVSAVT
jgi:signal transduction histidine kinase